ncbi:MAG: hypothetical protein ACTSRG_19185 [Candidatus Helarchaeota archaeon]
MNTKLKQKIENMCKKCKWGKIGRLAYCELKKEYIAKLPIKCEDFSPTIQRKIDHFLSSN